MADEKTPPDSTAQGGAISPAAGESAAAPPPSGKAVQKVELDLDDAPFLEDEEEPAKEVEPAPKAEAPASEDLSLPAGKPSLKDRLLAKKKLLIIIGAALVVVIAGAVITVRLLSGPKAPPPPKQPEPTKVVLPDKPPPLPSAPMAKYLMQWDPFIVEMKDSEGNIRFLICKFAIPTDNEFLYAEMQQKKVLLRDAIFYYLRNRPIGMLTDKAKEDAFKQDLMTVINGQVGGGKATDVFIEQYLIK